MEFKIPCFKQCLPHAVEIGAVGFFVDFGIDRLNAGRGLTEGKPMSEPTMGSY